MSNYDREKELKEKFCQTYKNWSASTKDPNCLKGEYRDRFYFSSTTSEGQRNQGWVLVPAESQAVEFRLWKEYVKARDAYLSY